MEENRGPPITGGAEGRVEAGRAVCEGRGAEGAALVERVQVVGVVEAGGAVGVNRRAGFALNCVVEGVPLNTVVAVVST